MIFKSNDPAIGILQKTLGPQAQKAEKALKKHRIETVGQLSGALMPLIPVSSERDRRQRQLVCSLGKLKTIKSPKNVIKKISKLFNISSKQASEIYELLKKVEQPNQVYNMNFSFGFGLRNHKTKISKKKPVLKGRKTRKRSSGLYVVQDYDSAGPVYNQGSRGTCVANAAVSLIDYKQNGRFSRQFTYHQCKMIDGIKDEEGTYIHIPFMIFSDSNYVDCGTVSEEEWPYNTHQEDTTHQGPPPENAFDCVRAKIPDSIYLGTGNVEEIKNLLHLDNQGKNSPVVIGVALFESFFSHETRRTGWCTMPLPGESIVGYHAMLIVGYDADRDMFLVRNSWGSSWASENDKGFPGHAWIPYEYIKEYCHAAATIVESYTEHTYVNNDERLYNNSKKNVKSGAKKAAFPSQNRKQRSVNKKPQTAAIESKRTQERKKAKKRSGVPLFIKLMLVGLLIFVFKDQLFVYISNAIFWVKEFLPVDRIYNMLS